MATKIITTWNPQLEQRNLFFDPEQYIEQIYKSVYQRNEIFVGWPEGAQMIFDQIARPNTAAIIGIEIGDEGKGKVVDNKLEALLAIKDLKLVYVDRFNGGNNAGHTTENDEVKLALHQVPSGILHPEVIGIMDTGMSLNPDDLKAEVEYVERSVGDTRGKLIVSENAILNTDLERVEEQLNKIKQEKSKGATGRGIGPSYAHHIDKLGLHIKDLKDEKWRETLAKQYDRYEKELSLYQINLKNTEVPDLDTIKKTGKDAKRKVGTKDEFLDRLESARSWLIDRDMVQNTFILHKEIYQDLKKGFLLEAAQAVSLHPWLGTRPDVTESDTTVYGIPAATQLWRPQDILDRIGVMKLTYTSSVGARRMPTHREDEKSRWIRDKANERGTTTGRDRDILALDLEMLRFNAWVGGIEVLFGTHLDIARPDMPIQVCTHYTNKAGEIVHYQPGLDYLEDVEPHYIELPSWDGEAVAKAKSFDNLPIEAKQFLSFVQQASGMPIVGASNGPKREHLIELPGYHPSDRH